MSAYPLPRRSFLQVVGGSGLLAASGCLEAQEAAAPAKGKKTGAVKVHPLTPALELARKALDSMHTSVRDYEATMRKQERVGGKLNPPEKMFIRVRQPQEVDGEEKPFAVYLKFLDPASVKGQEVLWVKGKNNNKLLGHQGGTLGRFTPAIWLDPKGALAMRGNRYSITDVGIENLVVKLIEKGERDLTREECEVELKEEEFDDRLCTLIEVRHPVRREYFDFHIAKIWVDQERLIPLRYAAYEWPPQTGGEALLLEDYAYYDLKLNVGLDDDHFNELNKSYGFH